MIVDDRLAVGAALPPTKTEQPDLVDYIKPEAVDFIKPELGVGPVAAAAAGEDPASRPGGDSGGGGFKDPFPSINCSGCGYGIHEEFILKVGEKSWHSQCLRCSVCDLILTYDNSCFIRDDKILCRQDYTKIFGTRCSKCCHLITQNDWIRRAGDQVFHLACFACDSCTRQLSTGEEFGLVEGRVLCKSHYLEIIEGGSGSSTDGDCCESEAQSKKRKSKRNRTTFTDEQIHILQANFQIDCNPDGQDLERIADISGLSKRVVQVWFQNARARNKKYITKNRSVGGGGGGGGMCQDQIDVNIAFSAFYTSSPDLFISENELETSSQPCFTPPTQV